MDRSPATQHCKTRNRTTRIEQPRGIGYPRPQWPRACADDEGYISDGGSTYDASDDNDDTDEPLIHDEDVSSYEINKNNIALENNTGMNLQHDVIAGVRD